MGTGAVTETEDRVFEKWEMPDGTVLCVHAKDTCIGTHCVIHNPKPSHMDSWTLHYRHDRNIFERLCPDHSIGHPDPSQQEYWDEIGESWQATHGCCGCCSVVGSAQPKQSGKRGS